MRLQEDPGAPGRSLLATMRAPAAGGVPAAADGTAADFEDIESVDAALAEAKAWRPTAVALDNLRLRRAASFDVMATLVGIYGDARFVSEYQCAVTAVLAHLHCFLRVGLSVVCALLSCVFLLLIELGT